MRLGGVMIAAENCGKVADEESRAQSPMRSRCSHSRKSRLKPMLSAILKLAITHLSICLPDFSAVSEVRFPSRMIEVRYKSVAFDGCRLK